MSILWLWNNDPIVLFEALASEFKRTHRMNTPGRDYAPELCREEEDHGLRGTRYKAWRDAMGPTDIAALVSVWLMREEQANASE